MSALAQARRRALLAASIAIGLTGALAGCGLKGALYLPSQKRAKVPPSPASPEPESPGEPHASSAPTAPGAPSPRSAPDTSSAPEAAPH